MKIDIGSIAELARLYIDENEREKLESDMESIIAMVDNLPEINRSGYEADTEPMKLRYDKVTDCEISRKELMKNAPLTREDCFTVPKTV